MLFSSEKKLLCGGIFLFLSACLEGRWKPHSRAGSWVMGSFTCQGSLDDPLTWSLGSSELANCSSVTKSFLWHLSNRLRLPGLNPKANSSDLCSHEGGKLLRETRLSWSVTYSTSTAFPRSLRVLNITVSKNLVEECVFPELFVWHLLFRSRLKNFSSWAKPKTKHHAPAHFASNW